MKWREIKSAPANTKVLLYYPDDHYASHRFRIGRLVYDRPGFDCPKEWHWECDGYMSSTIHKPKYWAKLKFKEVTK